MSGWPWLLSHRKPGYQQFRVMEPLKYTNMAPDFCPYSRRINVIILFLMAIDATKKTGKKTSPVVYFIVPMALIPCLAKSNFLSVAARLT